MSDTDGGQQLKPLYLAGRVIDRLQEKVGGGKVSYRRFGGRRVVIRHRGEDSDRAVVWQCFRALQYEVPIEPYRTAVQSFYERLVAKNHRPLIIDCGAHIGASSIWFSLRYPQAEVVAVEPAPDNHALLLENVGGLPITPVQAAIASTVGSTKMRDMGWGGWAYRTGGDGDEVPTTTIDELMEQDRGEPFILKVDIEGAEKALFASPSPKLAAFPVIIIETHDMLFPGMNYSTPFWLWHASKFRDFAFNHENTFSLDWHRLEPDERKIPQKNHNR
jgi:FkbM family methyltransferase